LRRELCVVPAVPRNGNRGAKRLEDQSMHVRARVFPNRKVENQVLERLEVDGHDVTFLGAVFLEEADAPHHG
jgi:hypothetical protein